VRLWPEMKILVPTKRVPSTDERVRIRPDGLGIEDAGLAYMINPFDAIALEEALHIPSNAIRMSK
jgi:electron transfer flavoprotein beta subunit